MSAQAQDKRKLKEKVDRLISRAFSQGESKRFLDELKSRGELALIGGAIRDAYLEGTQNFTSDFDFVIHPRNENDFSALMRRYGAAENRFGGYRLEINRWKIDVWHLQNTWARKAKHREVHNFEDLLHVTFFDWDAVIYNLSTSNVIVGDRYFEKLGSGVMDVNLLPNPNPLGNAIRALRYACRWNVAFGPALALHVRRILQEYGKQCFLDAEKESFSSPLLTAEILDCALAELNKRIHLSKGESVRSLAPLKANTPQHSMLTVLESPTHITTSAGVALNAPYDARAIANFLLDLADEKKSRLTQVSLLKLIYFAHGWFLSAKGSRLIQQDFEAWQYGPVVKVVRDEFKQFGGSIITARARKLDIYTGLKSVVSPSLAVEDAQFVRTIFDAYHVYDAWKLSEMTHEPGSPWDQIWNSEKPVGRMALRIRDEDIRAHFDSLSKRVRLS